MKKQMKKAVYEAPCTERFQIELEGVFCASVEVSADNKTNGQIENHGVNDSFNATFDASNWD